jgi:hypothetical protein
MVRPGLMYSACFALVLFGAPGVRAQENPPEIVEVVAVVDAFHAALAVGDSTTALSLLAENVVILENGSKEDKTHYRSGHLSGDIRFAQAVPRQRSEIEVRIVGGVAWAHSTSISQGQMGERTIDSQGAELMVLVRETGVWKINAIHWSSRARR